MKTVISLFTLVFCLAAFGQQTDFEAPDYQQIEKNIKNKKSEFYYPDLLERFEKRDTLLTDEHYDHLYYGFVFDERYAPYFRDQREKEIQEFYNKDKLSSDEKSQVYELIDQLLKENPFNLSVMNFLFQLKFENGEQEEGDKVLKNLIGILRTIMYSGNGESCETAFHVIRPTDEYAFMGMLGFQPEGQALIGNCDLQNIAENEDGITEIYFDISKPFKKLGDSLR